MLRVAQLDFELVLPIVAQFNKEFMESVNPKGQVPVLDLLVARICHFGVQVNVSSTLAFASAYCHSWYFKAAHVILRT
jgi:hypothetical protein